MYIYSINKFFNKMKKTFSLLSLLISLFAMSQSTDLDRQDFNYSYVQLPSTPISEVKNSVNRQQKVD